MLNFKVAKKGWIGYFHITSAFKLSGVLWMDKFS